MLNDTSRSASVKYKLSTSKQFKSGFPHAKEINRQLKA